MARAKVGQTVMAQSALTGAEAWPALVTRVWSDDEVNVTIFPDGLMPQPVASLPWGSKAPEGDGVGAWPLPR
jgi:hypothetical protein